MTTISNFMLITFNEKISLCLPTRVYCQCPGIPVFDFPASCALPLLLNNKTNLQTAPEWPIRGKEEAGNKAGRGTQKPKP